MNQINKILSFKSLILFLTFFLVGTNIYSETTLEKIKRTGKATVGTEAAFPPFEFVEDGRLAAEAEENSALNK